MSDVASALAGASYEGMARIEEVGPQGMVSIRGDLNLATLEKAVSKVAGVGMPGPGGAPSKGQKTVCWMSPDELLILLPYAEAAQAVAAIGEALAGEHHLVADVSDARALFLVSGPGAREALAKLAPVDLHPSAFGPGQFRRTRLAQVAAAFRMRDDEAFEVICFRSVAAYVFEILSLSARRGAEVGYF